MPAACRRQAESALRRGVLLLGLLAIVAGFLGMHVMAGMHSSSALDPAASGHHLLLQSPTVNVDMAAQAHPGDDSGAPAAAGHPSMTGLPVSCDCHSSCPGHESMHSVCTPSAAAGSLSAPMPGASRAWTLSPGAADGGAIRLYSYVPGSPTPGDLSISRT